MSYKAIGFDYGGVVNGVPGFVFMRAMADFLVVSLDDLHEVFLENSHLSSTGKMSWVEMWSHMATLLKRSEKCREVSDFIYTWDKEQVVNQRVIQLIKNVRLLGYKVGLLSNWENGLRERLDKQGIASQFDVIGISSEMGVMKPQSEAFFKFCEMLGVRPQELVFIDDSEKSFETVEAVGYTPVLFRDYAGLVKDLKALGIKL